MSVSVSLLLLLLPVLSLCGATEYYVRPTESTNTSCPGQPCLTLSQYSNNSDYYFKSNTLFKFLPGTHHINRTVRIRNIQNMSLESFHDQSDQYPHVVAQFNAAPEGCNFDSGEIYDKSCEVLGFYEVADVILKGITVIVYTTNISGIVFWDASNISLQSTTVYSHTWTSGTCAYGILLVQLKFVQVNLFGAYGFKYGFAMGESSNISISNVTAGYNYHDGIYLFNIRNAQVTNTITTHNEQVGLVLEGISCISIDVAISEHNYNHGLIMSRAFNVTITNICTRYNQNSGVFLYDTHNIRIINATITHNRALGLLSREVKYIFLERITAMFNGLIGIYLNVTTKSNLTNITVAHNVLSGISVSGSSDCNIRGIRTSYNGGTGFSIFNSQSINVADVSVQNNTAFETASAEASQKFGFIFQKIYAEILIWSSTEIKIYNSSFVDISPTQSAGTTHPSTLPAIIIPYRSTLEISECFFEQNHISAVRAHESIITLSGNVVFSNNTAVSGTAFILIHGSIISPGEIAKVKFENNYATNTGGVFYIGVNDYVYLGDTISYRKCFLNTPVDRSQINFIFLNNSAGTGGDILYGGQVAFALDGHWNCLESFENISTVSVYQNDFSAISSNPSRVCFCNELRVPDCVKFLDKKARSFYPGQNIYISAVTVGQNFGTVAGSIYAQYLKRSPTDNLLELDVSQKVQSVVQNRCNKLSYTLFPPKGVTELILVLTVEGTIVSSESNQIFSKQPKSLLQQYYHTSRTQPLLYSNNPVYVNISILPCPVGFMLTTDPPFKCDCNQLLQQISGVHCNIQLQTFSRNGLVWLGMLSNGNITTGIIAASQYCPFNYCNSVDSKVSLAKPDTQCSYNHSGILCGACQPGLSLALGSEQCLPCSNKYLALLIPFILAGPALVGFIKLLDLTISQGTMNGLIFYCNVIQTNQYIFIPKRSTHILSLFIAWVNLDLGVETCFFKGLNAYYKTWLQFIFPLYIWSIAGLIIIFSKYSIRVSKLMGNNSVRVLATLFLLSYAKLFRIITSVLSYTILHTSEGRKAVWSADGTVDYLSPKHMILFVVYSSGILVFSMASIHTNPLSWSVAIHVQLPTDCQISI